MPAPRPFPWAAHERVSREDADAVREFYRWLRARVRIDVAPEVLSSLLDTPVRLAMTTIRSRGAPLAAGSERTGARAGSALGASFAESIAVAIAPNGAEGWESAALVLVEPALGAALAARALRRSAPKVVEPRTAGEGVAGAVAAIVAAAARRASGGLAIKVLDVGTARELEPKMTAGDGVLLEASFTVLFNGESFAARVLVPRSATFAAAEPPWTRASLAALGEMPVAVSVVAAVSRSTAGEVGSLRRGDAWIPGGWRLRASPGGALEGPVLLAAPGHEAGVSAHLSEGAHLAIGERVERLAWTPEADERATRGGRTPEPAHGQEETVSEAERDALVDAVGEVPVVVRVEIGAVEMRAKEWASLAPGDIVALAKKIGDTVTLSVGGVTVARGELVDLEGEIAVRILGRSDTETPPVTQARPAQQER